MVPCYIRDEEEGDTGGLQVGVPAECVMPYLPAVHGHGNHEPYAHHARLAHRATSATCYTAQSPRRPASHLLHPLCPIGRSNRAYELAHVRDDHGRPMYGASVSSNSSPRLPATK